MPPPQQPSASGANTHEVIPAEYGDDEAFVLASDLVHDAEGWTVRVDGEPVVAGPETDRPLEAVRDASPARTDADDGVRWTGEILLSSGVVVLLNGELAMLWRDDDAPEDAHRWQSPAGRCEGPPGETGLREFYEELVVLEGGRPAFVRFDERSPDYEDEYEAALRRVDRHAPPVEWERYEARVPEAAEPHLETVEVTCGDERWTDELLVFLDEDASTLECRFVVAVDVDDPQSLELLDGEFDRRVERHAPADVVAMDRDDLVPTDAYLADALYPDLLES